MFSGKFRGFYSIFREVYMGRMALEGVLGTVVEEAQGCGGGVI